MDVVEVTEITTNNPNEMDLAIKDHLNKGQSEKECDMPTDEDTTTIVCQIDSNKNETNKEEGLLIEPESVVAPENITKENEFSKNDHSVEKIISIDVDTVNDKEYVNIEQQQNMKETNHQALESAQPAPNEKNGISSLSVIAMEYEDSGSETGSCNYEQADKDDCGKTNVKDQQANLYRSQTAESLASSDESDSSSDSSDTSSDSSVSVLSEDADSDTSTNKTKNKVSRQQKENKMKFEWDDLPPIEELKISVPEVLCEPFGEVAWMVEQLVIVKPKLNKPTLNLDTVLFIDKGKRTLGKIFDVFGAVSDPHYSVRFNSTDHIKESDVRVGMTVYYCPNTEYTSLVFLHELTKMKGIDVNADGEPPDFSDDEEERLYYENLRKEQAKNKNDSNLPHKRPRNSNPTSGWESNHPWNRNKPKRDGHGTRRQNRQHAPPPPGGQAYNAWLPPYSYQNWSSMPYRFREPYGMQQMPYVNPNAIDGDQTSQDSQNYNTETGMTMPMRPRTPFIPNARFPPNFPVFNYNRPAPPSSNLRFRHPGIPWQSQSPIRMNTPWSPLSRLPPPPPPPPSDNS